MAKGTLKEKDYFSLCKTHFQPGYPEKKYPGPPANAVPIPLPFTKGAHFWTPASCCGRIPISMDYIVIFQVEINP